MQVVIKLGLSWNRSFNLANSPPLIDVFLCLEVADNNFTLL